MTRSAGERALLNRPQFSPSAVSGEACDGSLMRQHRYGKGMPVGRDWGSGSPRFRIYVCHSISLTCVTAQSSINVRAGFCCYSAAMTCGIAAAALACTRNRPSGTILCRHERRSRRWVHRTHLSTWIGICGGSSIGKVFPVTMREDKVQSIFFVIRLGIFDEQSFDRHVCVLRVCGPTIEQIQR